MGNENLSQPGQKGANMPPEADPYRGIENAALVVKFYEMGADPEIGRELSLRLMAHSGYAGDPATEPLIGKDGKPVLDAETGQPLTLADYVNFATEDHFYAVEGILNFLHTKPGEPEYEEGRAAYSVYLDANRRQAGRS